MKLLNRILIALFIIIDVWYIYDRIRIGTTDRLLVAFTVIPILLGPYLIQKIFHYEMKEPLKFIYYLFTFCCVILGSVLNLYNLPQTRGFDKFTHFISGFLTSLVALLVLKKAQLKNKKTWFIVVFIILFSTAVAGIWEYFEFFCDKITGGDTQHVLDSGIQDTMLDMLVATGASILFSIYYIYSYKKAKVNHIKKIEEYL
ncbi:MAG: DUF2238 domain-containing protein [Bacilli bacterium]|nr:DUF2238 domain-containing protein [Bacilli bacterium]